MGFIKRLLSMGSKKGKKSKRTQLAGTPYEATAHAATSEDVSFRKRQQDDEEANANRLLRSSSAHFTVVSEVDYASLPPIPHPVNGLSPAPPGSPGRASSIQSHSTYHVKVHGRTVHTRTEFPNANPPLPIDTPPRPSNDSTPSLNDQHTGTSRNFAPITPRDKNRLYRLRQDPSVASLMDMYDNNGRLDNKAFSNSPAETDRAVDAEKQEKETEKELLRAEGRAQVKRSGSTLRQLLGEPAGNSKAGDLFEGDISWAERHIEQGEDDSSSASSQGLVTPVNPDYAFAVDPSIVQTPHGVRNTTTNNPNNNATFLTETTDENDRSASEQLQAISSMEVELSISTEERTIIPRVNSPYRDPESPYRASEIFSFLNKPRTDLHKRASSVLLPGDEEDGDEEDAYGGFERPLPALPTHMDSDSSTDSALNIISSSIQAIATGSTIKPTVDDNFLSPRVGSITHRPSTKIRHSTDNRLPTIADVSQTSSDSPSSAGSILDDPPQLALIMNRTPTPVGNGPLREGPRAQHVQFAASASPSGPARAPSTTSSSSGPARVQTNGNVIGSRIPRGPRGSRTSLILNQDFFNPFDDAAFTTITSTRRSEDSVVTKSNTSRLPIAKNSTTTKAITAKAQTFNTPTNTPTPKAPQISTASAALPLRTNIIANSTAMPSSIPLRSGSRLPSATSSISSKHELAATSVTAYPTPTPTPSSADWKAQKRMSSYGTNSVASVDQMPKLIGSAARGASIDLPSQARGPSLGKENSQSIGLRALPASTAYGFGSRSLDLVRAPFITSADADATMYRNMPTAMSTSRLPVTPARSRAIFDAGMTPGAAPSPASSSNLSPIGQQMMAELRETKRRAFARFGGGGSAEKTVEKRKNMFVDVGTSGRS